MSWDEHIAKLTAVEAAAPAAATLAVHDALAPVFEDSQSLVPTDTELLKSTGTNHEPQIDGTVVIGQVTYGSDETITPWRGLGIGYEIFVHEGHAIGHTGREQPPNKFLEIPTLDHMAEMPEVMGAGFQKSLTEEVGAV